MTNRQMGQYGIAEDQPGTGRRRGDAPPGPYESDLEMQGDVAPTQEKPLTTFLGWFSLGFGLVEVLAPRTLLNLIGIKDHDANVTLTRVMGVREIFSGIGIFVEPRPVTWIQARIAGDGMDIALLSRALTSEQAKNQNSVIAALLSVLAITAMDIAADQILTHKHSQVVSGVMEDGVMRVRKSITVNRPIAEVYAFWRNFENLPRFMSHIQSVKVLGNGQTRWTAQSPDGNALEWEAALVGDTPNEMIAWQAVEGGEMRTSGIVQLRPAPGNRGTEVLIDLEYEPPLGKLGTMFSRLFGSHPEQMIRDELHMFKQIIETGEVVRSDGAVPGQKMGQRPAQPIPDENSRTENRDSLAKALLTGRRGSK
jgi:uncharacterized membrane protein